MIEIILLAIQLAIGSANTTAPATTGPGAGNPSGAIVDPMELS